MDGQKTGQGKVLPRFFSNRNTEVGELVDWIGGWMVSDLLEKFILLDRSTVG
jgi:hypothetical protein